MKSSLRKYAPAGLILALLASLSAIGFAIVQRSFTLPVQISVSLAVIGVALFVLLDPQKTREILTGRQARYSSNALVLALAFTGILIALNYLVYTRAPRWDLTEDQQHTLAKETLETLKSLQEPVVAEAYYSSRFPSTTAQDLLESYKYNANGKFSYEFIDPEKDPVRARSANVTRDGTIVLKQGNRSEQVTYASEADLTSALVRLANPGKRAVYFLIGHGEYSPDDSGDRSYSEIKSLLSAKNYTVNTLNLLATRNVPEDALALIIAGPDKPVSTEEISLIQAYLDRGGSLIYLAEPTIVTHFGETEDPLATYLEKQWGIRLGQDMVIDLNYNPPSVAVSAKYAQHPITERMYNLAVVMPSARSVSPVQIEGNDVQSYVLTETAQNSWAEKDFNSLRNNQAAFNPEQDVAGPVGLAIAATNSKANARVVVIGDSDFASNRNYAQYGNGDFLINAIDWAAKQENLINLTPKKTTQRILILRNNITLGVILLTTVFLIPGLTLVAGILVWIQRRRRG